ncbi:MAG: hypothetical protein J6038_03105 [Bacilli bacterium]|nr:hypothetical protein [Bacilli bacterium]
MFKKFLLSRIFALVGAMLAILGFILYLVDGITVYSPSHSPLLIAMFIAAIALLLISALLPIKHLCFLSYLALLVGFIEFVASQINYLAAIIYPLLVGTTVDDVSLTPSFLIIAIALFSSCIIAFLAGKMAKEDWLDEKLSKKKEERQ